MATLPPRRNPTPTKISKQHLTPLQILLQMGFPKHRAEKALAATGHRGVQLASDWLLAHVHDPLLDDNSPREYILYACPIGEFLEHLQGFWERSLELCGWNSAHNYFPHITLMSFFKAPDECSLNLALGLKGVMERQGAVLNEPLKLETYTSPNFMGFFVEEEHADYLKRIALQYVKEVSSDTISLKPHVQSLHLSLAYQFPSNQYSQLKALVDELDPTKSGEWELRLYSRDSRLNGKDVYKVIHPYSPCEYDELELRTGDYIYVSSEAVSNSQDGWVEGTSWLTGLTGFLPVTFIKRTAGSDAWTLHKKVPLNCYEESRYGQEEVRSRGLSQASTLNKDEMGSLTALDIPEDAVESGESDAEGREVVTNGKEGNTERKLLLMRHGERVDFAFGSWIPFSFNESGQYIRKDLNMPYTLPERKLGPKAYFKDTPLTNIGIYQATLVGQGLKEANTVLQHVYCSPSFRCVQTCDAVLQACGQKDTVKIKIEPALFEWIVWYPDQFPEWFTPLELAEAGYNIDLNYTPLMTREAIMSSDESCEQFYKRSHYVTLRALSSHHTGNILFVGHAATLEVCSRELLGRKLRTSGAEMTEVIRKVPYCSLMTLEQNEDGRWEIVESSCPSLTHTNNQRFEPSIIDLP